MQIIKGVREIADRYSLFLVDLWGVMHDGVQCYPDALACLAELKRMKKNIALLSNAPRRVSDVIARSQALGLDPSLYDAAFSSGEATWRYLQNAPLGKKAFPIMTDKDLSLIEETPILLTDRLSDANFILCSGPEAQQSSLAYWRDILEEAKERHLPLLCANPDLIVLRGGKEEICAGTIAQYYETQGGKVIYHGKPFPDIYREIIRQFSKDDKQSWLAFGDSFRTDVSGAIKAGGESLFIAGGIHTNELMPELNQEKLAILATRYAACPHFVLDYLRW